MRPIFFKRSANRARINRSFPFIAALSCSACVATVLAAAQSGGNGLTVTLPQTESEVIRAVQAVSDDAVVHGTWVYDRDKTPSPAHSAVTSPVLPRSVRSGDTLYKVADAVIAPRFFKGSEDIGSITVRYEVQRVDDAHTRLAIQAVFVESARKETHPSTGEVEKAEYGAIQTELQRIQALANQQKAFEAEANTYRSARAVPATSSSSSQPATPAMKPVTSALDTGARSSLPAESHPADASAASELSQLQARVNELTHKVEMRVKASGAPVRSAPYHGATTLTSVAASADVLILVITPHWYGVETHDGHHGWIHGSQLEPLP